MIALPVPPTGPVPVARAPTAATVDARTGVLTDRAWRSRAVRILTDDGTAWALLLVDVDRFARLGSEFGQLGADGVLAAVAGTLRATAAGSGIVGRFGGDGFVVLVPAGAPSVARQVADRARLAVRRMHVGVDRPDGRLRIAGISVSIGVAPPTGSADLAALLWAADAALYRAKRAGGDAVRSA